MKTKQKQWGKILAVFVAFGVSLFAALPSYAALADGLVAYYPFNGDANDASGNGNHGIENGGVTYASGVIGSAAKFDGVNDFIEITPVSNVSMIGDFSISVWTNLSDFKNQGVKDRQYIFDGHSYSNTTTSDFFSQGVALIYDGDTSSEEIHDFIHYSENPTVALEQNTPVSVKGKWLHHVFIRKGSVDYTYINGLLINSTHRTEYNYQSNSPLDMQHNWFIGTFSGNNPNYSSFNYSFYGLLDDMRIYNRALTAAEITTLYNQSNPIQGTAPWKTAHTVTCQNITQNKTVIIPKTKVAAWNCEQAGLPVNHGDKVKVTIDGTKY